MMAEKKTFLKTVLLRGGALAALLGLLYFNSMKFAAVLLLLLAAAAFCIHGAFREKPGRQLLTLGLFVCAAIFLNVVFNLRALPNQLPADRFTPGAFYTMDFLEEGLYADSFLRMLADGRQVKVHDEGKPYEHPVFRYQNDSGEWETSVGYDDDYYGGRDYVRFFRTYAAEVSVEETLLPVASLGEERLSQDFVCLGMANDMMRYLFAVNDDGLEHSGSFWYDYYYSHDRELFYIYVNPQKIDGDAALVALWDEADNLYVMSEAYYREAVAGAKE